MKLRAAIILDNMLLSKWQRDALDAASKKLDIVLVLNCKNTKIKRNIYSNLLYYVLNIFSLKNSQTKKVKFAFKSKKIINFNSHYVDNWQELPNAVVKELNFQNIDIVIKFGMNLLSIDPDFKKIPFLSYHHGNPSKYRGRPAGFYEIINNEKKLGIIVQILSNKLDAGEILAFAESKVARYSYKKTAANFYGNSKYLLSKAIDNLIAGKTINLDKHGTNYKLPSNFVVLKFWGILIHESLKKLLYGLFFEKKWMVALVKDQLSFLGDERIPFKNLNVLPIHSGYNFYADPFFSKDFKSIYLEALNSYSGMGDIVEIRLDCMNIFEKILTGEHYSYPYIFEYNGKEYILPEVSYHSSQFFYALGDESKRKFYIKGLEKMRVVDATLFENDGIWYLFFNDTKNTDKILNLWVSSSPFNKFNPHPNSPILISPDGARMGGKIANLSSQFFRFGQNNSGEYGESVSVFKITKITLKEYEEDFIGNIEIDGFKGPHTINFDKKNELILLDYYENKFSIFAGARRLIARIKKNNHT